MTNRNAIIPYDRISVKTEDLAETVGITQFAIDDNEDNWFQTIGGLLIQGGRIVDVPANSSQTIDFHRAYPKKVFGVWIQLIAAALAGSPPGRHFVNVISLSQFDVYNDYVDDSTYYWWAVGV